MLTNIDLDWRLREGDSNEARLGRWEQLPGLPDETDPLPENYYANQALLDAANTALYLSRPLLLTGEPGSGKTEFARHLAWRLGLERPYKEGTRKRAEYMLRFDTKSESRARDLFYTIDQVARFQQAQSKEGDVDPLPFMEFQAMGRAILYAREPDDLAERLDKWQAHPGKPCRSVVLIDEIDKAPRDFPNDLLMEIERMRFFIPELRRTVQADPQFRPIIVVTSNSEKTLPDAFLRRCVYYNIDFPEPELLKDIVSTRLAELPRGAGLVDDAVALFGYLRRLALRKRPGTAELLDFVRALLARGFAPSDRLTKREDWRFEAAQTLLKIQDDHRIAALPDLSWERIEGGGAGSGDG